MAKASLASMSVDALLKLRDDIGKVLSSKTNELKDQLSRLGVKIGYKQRGRPSSLKGRKAAVKYRDRAGNTWAGRGARPVWLREKLKAGGKLEDFCCSEDSGRPQSFPEEIQEAPKGQTLSWTFGSSHTSIRR